MKAKFLTKDAEKLEKAQRCHMLTGRGCETERLSNNVQACELEIEKRIRGKSPSVGDLSSHPVNEKLQKVVVKTEEVSWDEPKE